MSVLNYEQFHKFMILIRKQNRETEDLLDELDDSGVDCWDRVLNVCSIDNIVKLMSEIMEDEDEWISHYVYECNCDYDDPCSVWFDSEGNKHIIDGDKNLYDLITGVYISNGEKLSSVYCLTDKGRKYLAECDGNIN